jgi:hypothetical protein
MRYQENSLKHNLTISGIVLASVVLFMFLFRIEKPIDKVETEKETGQLFHMAPRDESMNAYQKEDAARDELDDPTIMSFPNLDHGFSAIRKEGGEPPVPGFPVYDFKLLKIDEVKQERIPLVSNFPDPVIHAGNTLPKPEMEQIIPVKVKGRFSKRIVWLEDGVEKLSPIKIDEVLKITENKIPEGRTEISILKVTKGHAFFLLRKCGIKELDKVVLNHFKNKSLIQFTDDKNTEILPKTVVVDWRLLQ